MKWWEDAIGGAAMSPRSRNIASPQSGRYADDAGSTAGSQPGGPKLTVVRHLRKQAQNDAQLLINRIALLRVRHCHRALAACKGVSSWVWRFTNSPLRWLVVRLQQEEAKARKKIQETQLRAQEMLELKKHTVEKLAVKQQREAAAKKKQELVRQRVEKQKRAHAKKMEVRGAGFSTHMVALSHPRALVALPATSPVGTQARRGGQGTGSAGGTHHAAEVQGGAGAAEAREGGEGAEEARGRERQGRCCAASTGGSARTSLHPPPPAEPCHCSHASPALLRVRACACVCVLGCSQRERQARVIEEYERKIEEENARRAAKEAEVRRMEKEELKLIEALKKVQVLQREAFEELEAALAGENGGPPPRGRQRKSSIKSSARSSSARSTSKRRTGKKRGTKRGSKGSRGSQRSQRPAA